MLSNHQITVFKIIYALLLTVAFTACHTSRKAQNNEHNPLRSIVRDARLDSIIAHPEWYEVQIIYTQIDRDTQQRPHFTVWHWNVDSTQYFYPASTVKMPLAFLALERINALKASGYPKLNRNTAYMLDSLRAFQQAYKTEPTAPAGKPSIAQDIRQVFAVSDNFAYNHLFEFLGRDYINQTLQNKGYDRTGIVHRFNFPARDNRYSSPITFYEPTFGIFKEGEKTGKTDWVNPQQHTQKGIGFINSSDSLMQQPFDMRTKNWFALTDMERMLRAVLFPEAMPAQSRFRLTADDYQFLYRSMGQFPREFDYPKYDTAHYWDGYVKFFLMGDHKDRQDGRIRSFNKVGEAYGTLTDVAYIVDAEHHVEFVLAATILCNRDGIFNDDQYDYDTTGFPFLANLGRAVYAYELQRKRKVVPDLRSWEQVVKGKK